MKRTIIILFAILSTLVLTGCSSAKHAVEIVHDIQRDTLYINQTQYDSVYVYQNLLTDRSKDTVYIKDMQYQYKYKLLRDTCYLHQVDSIPVIKTVEVVKEVEVVKGVKYTPWYAQTLAWIGVLSILFLILLIFKKIYLK